MLISLLLYTNDPQNIGYAYMLKNSGKTWWPRHQNVDSPFDSGRLGWKTFGSTAGFSTKDGSYIKLRNAKIKYSPSDKFLKNLTGSVVSKLSIYLSGYNLILWAPDLPYAIQTGSGNDVSGRYPLFRRVTFGINVGF